MRGGPSYTVLAIARTRGGVRIVAVEGRGEITYSAAPELTPEGVRVHGQHGPVLLQGAHELTKVALGPPPPLIENENKRLKRHLAALQESREAESRLAERERLVLAAVRGRILEAIRLMEERPEMTVNEACVQAGTCAGTVYRWRELDKELGRRWTAMWTERMRKQGELLQAGRRNLRGNRRGVTPRVVCGGA